MNQDKKPENEENNSKSLNESEHWTDDSWQPIEDEVSREWTGLLPQQGEEEEGDIDWSTFEEAEVEKLSFEEEEPKIVREAATGDKSKVERKKAEAPSKDQIVFGPFPEDSHVLVHPLELNQQSEEPSEKNQIQSKVETEEEVLVDTREILGPPAPPKPKVEPPKPLTMKQKVESILFAAPNPIKISDIADVLLDEAPKARVLRSLVEEIKEDFKQMERGFELIKIGETFQFRTLHGAAPLMERMFSSRPRPLSRAAQETLAIIAYRQPVTRADIEFIRGVDAGSIIKNLLERELIQCVGRREISGRPMLFGTTDEFLAIYQLSKIEDLPPLASFQPNYDTRETLAALNLDEEVDITEFVDDKAVIADSPPSEQAE